MADSKISALPASTTPLVGTEVLPIVQSGTTKQVSAANLTAGRAVAMLSNTVGTSPGAVTPVVQADDLVVQNSGAAGITILSPDANAGRVVFGTVSNNQNVILYGEYNYGFDVYLEGNKVIHFDTPTKDTTWSLGNIIQGTAAKGINFTANTPAAGMTSQLLNWYEEGTFTPTIAFATPGDTSITYSQQNGKYTRIGRQVFFEVRVLTSAITWTTASGVLRVLGLPFTPNSGSPALVPHTAILSVWTKAGYTYPVAVTSPSDTTLYFRVGGSGVSQAYLTATEFVSGVNMDIQVNGSFFV